MIKIYKSFLALVLAVLCCGGAHAQSNMTFFEPSGGSLASWSLLDVTKVTFNGSDIVVTGKMGVEQYFDMNNVMSIKFTDSDDTPSSVTTIRDITSQLRIATSESSIRVIGATSGTVTIWNPSGQQLYSNRNWNGEDINIAHLERGIYIITINNTSIKFKK